MAEVENRIGSYGGYRHIDNLMLTSPWGQTLEQSVRWGRYKPPSLTNEQWVGLLGRDVNNFHHMSLMRGFTAWFVDTCNQINPRLNGYVTFDSLSRDALLLTATVHDFAEAIHTDIPAPEKTKDDEAQEIETLNMLLPQVLGLESGAHELQIISDIMSDPASGLGHTWRTIEDMGYIRAGLVAHRQVFRYDRPRLRIQLTEEQWQDATLAMMGISFRIAQREIPKLLRARHYARYYAVASLLDTWKPIITHAYDTLDAPRLYEALATAGIGDAAKEPGMVDEYYEARDVWASYVTDAHSIERIE